MRRIPASSAGCGRRAALGIVLFTAAALGGSGVVGGCSSSPASQPPPDGGSAGTLGQKGGSTGGGAAGTAGSGGSAGAASGGAGGIGGAAGRGGGAGTGTAGGGAGRGGGSGQGGSAGTGGTGGAGGIGGAAGRGGGSGQGGGAGSGGGGTGGAADIVWQYLGPQYTVASSVVVDSAHVIHVAGYDQLAGAGVHLRLDENGNFLSLNNDPVNGGSRYDDVAIDAADNIYFVGATGGTKAFVRWSGVGADSWGHAEAYSAPNAAWSGAKTDSQGRIVVAGSSYTSTAIHTILRRYLPAGGFDIDMIDTVNDSSVGVTVGANDSIYVAGRNDVAGASSTIASTATLTGWTEAGVQLFQVLIPNKSSCPTTGAYTNGLSTTFDGAGGLWFLGAHCDYQAILRKYDATTGALLLSADYDVPGGNSQHRLASDGTSLAVAGNGTWMAAEPETFQLYDADLQGRPLRKFSYALSADDALLGVAFIGRDRIVVGYSRDPLDIIYHIWVARLRAP